MKKNKALIILFCGIIIVAAAVSICAFLGYLGGSEAAGGASGDAVEVEASEPGLTIVRSPEQTEPTRPDGFPDPEENWIKLPEGPNLAEGKAAVAGEHTEIFEPANVTDGDLNSYWESKGVPADITIDLGDSHDIQTIAVRLNPVPIWEARTQNIEILLSTDGTSFTTAVPDTRYEFDPDSGNLARIDFDTTAARYVRLNFSAKSSGRSNGGQAAEICVFE